MGAGLGDPRIPTFVTARPGSDGRRRRCRRGRRRRRRRGCPGRPSRRPSRRARRRRRSRRSQPRATRRPRPARTTPGPLLERIDFEEQAEELAPLLGDRAHLVGHSYGAVISLLMAARRPGLVRSLTVSEPPAFRLARGRPEVELLIAELQAFFAAGP